MSGSSLDGIDAALVRIDNSIKLLGFVHHPFEVGFAQQLRSLTQDTTISLAQYGTIDSQLGKLFAAAVQDLLAQTNTKPTAVAAIGSHGQTIYHAPNSQHAFCLQIGDANIVAQTTGISTIADFRRADIAAQGQGAPLVPPFQRAFFAQFFDLATEGLAVVNIGGIANITYLHGEDVLGFDTGPGNTLMDGWHAKHRGQPFDDNGNWAKSTPPCPLILSHLKSDPYFAKTPPKSCGTEYFSPSWLHNKLADFANSTSAEVQASLCSLTADTITDAINMYAPKARHTLICGGGAHNSYLVHLIAQNLPIPVATTHQYAHPDHLEAMAFAWLASRTAAALPGNCPPVTGASKSVVLGSVHNPDPSSN